MAISIITASATTLTDGASDPGLISQLNTALAPLLADNIRGVSFITQGDDRFIGNELQVAITYDTLGSPIANPYVAAGFQAKSIESVKSAMLAFISAHPSYFFSTAWIQPIPMQRNGGQYVGLIFYNVNAAQGAANWAVNGGASAGNVFTGHMLAVDAVVGDDAIAATLPYQAPFLTIQAAISAATSGDTVILRPGTYTSATTIVLKDGVNIRAEPGAVVSVTGNFKAIFGDSSDPFSGAGTAVTCRIMGHAKLLSVGHQIAVALRAASTVTLECDEIDLATSGLPIVYLAVANQKAVIVKVVGRARCGEGIIQFFNDQLTPSTVTFEADTILAVGSAVVHDFTAVNEAAVICRAMTANALVTVGGGVGSGGTYLVEAAEDITVNVSTAVNAGETCSVLVRARNLFCTQNRAAVGSGGDAVIAFEISEAITTVVDLALCNSAGRSMTLTIRADRIVASASRALYVVAGQVVAHIEASVITAGVIVQNDAMDASALDIIADVITATDGGSYAFSFANTGGAGNTRIAVTADKIIAGFRIEIDANSRVDVRAGSLISNNASTRTFDVLSGTAFLWCGDCRGVVGGLPMAVYLRGGTTNLMGGRIIGADGDALGHAIAFNSDAAVVKIHPGTILIAGSDAGAFSIGLAGGATPTALAYGAIAANKAAEAGVTVDVGSLLVDAAVV